MSLGYEGRDLQMKSRVQTYNNVYVAQKVADRDFWVQPSQMKPLHIQLCSESEVDWHKGEVLDDWTFEQKQGCKHVVSYHEKPQGELNAAIQMR